MKFNRHSNIEGKHAFLGASKWHWLNYSKEQLIDSWHANQATLRGTILHAFAAQCIKLDQRLPRNTKTLNTYVNDAIGFKMTPEQPLYYSDNCFGTADAILFKNDLLRIHDLKTGRTPAHMEQLEIYAALFCLEYGIDPSDIQIELRIYQNDEITALVPDPIDIMNIMDKIVDFDEVLNTEKEKE